MTKDEKIEMLIEALEPFSSPNKAHEWSTLDFNNAAQALNAIDGGTYSQRRCASEMQIQYLAQSNYIEGEYSNKALDNAVLMWRHTTTSSITPYTIQLWHDGLLFNINLSQGESGEWRDFPVTVGGRHCHYESEASITKEVEKWCESYGEANTPELIQNAHVAFEMIHPFGDGNGRIGRFIMLWQTVKAGLPVEIIYPKDVEEYYKWFE